MQEMKCDENNNQTEFFLTVLWQVPLLLTINKNRGKLLARWTLSERESNCLNKIKSKSLQPRR